jgi:Rod binding domain-containing protein
MVAPLALFGLSLAANLVDGIAGSVKKAAAGAKEAETRKTAQDFETMFMEQTLERMTESTGEEGPLGENGPGGAVYKSMLAKEHAKSIVKTGGLGIADQVYRQMMLLQEGDGHVGPR